MNVNPFSYLIEKLKGKVDKSGDTMTGKLTIEQNTDTPLSVKRSNMPSAVYMEFSNYNGVIGYLGVSATKKPIFHDTTDKQIALMSDIDKGSVSVTADGVKNYSQLLNELKSLIDFSKVGVTTKLSLDTTYFTISYNGGANAIFSQVDISSQLPSIVRMNISSNSSLTTYQNNSYADISNNVLSSGKKIVLYY